jgi:hypothetical protein
MLPQRRGLTPTERSEYDAQGFVRLRQVFSPEEAAAMEDRVWSALHRKHGVDRNDRTTWQIPLSAGLQSLRDHKVFGPIGGPALQGGLDDLIGVDGWTKPKHWGSFLVSFPVANDAAHRIKPLWHTDFPFAMPTDRIAGAIVFSFFGDVPAGTGGTLALAGSHRIIERFIDANPDYRRAKMKVTRHALMKSDAWLTALCAQSDTVSPAQRFAGEANRVGEIPARVVELCGEPGDVVIGHPWLLHSPWPNYGDRPRMMRVQRIVSSD